MSLARSPDLPATRLAAVAVELARAGGDSAILARTVLAGALRREPDNEAVLLAVGEVELRMGRRERALDQLRRLSELKGGDSDKAILEKLLAIAATGKDGAAEALSFVEETDLATRWEPLVHALAHLSRRDEQRLEKLAPEMREFTEIVEKRISDLRPGPRESG